jgi:hypothetical protein
VARYQQPLIQIAKPISSVAQVIVLVPITGATFVDDVQHCTLVLPSYQVRTAIFACSLKVAGNPWLSHAARGLGMLACLYGMAAVWPGDPRSSRTLRVVC